MRKSIKTPLEAVRRAQAAVRAHVPAGRSLADELIAERRGLKAAPCTPDHTAAAPGGRR